jgi:predicted nucleotidyltransferase component of viral defense system
MSLFEQLVAAAVENQPELAPLEVVVEKELLQHDIIREMSKAGLLKHLTFIGGTCLRACYGSNRLSEDLDFTGGSDFTRESLVSLALILTRQLKVKYDLLVEVSEPVRESGNVDTWKLKVCTRPDQPRLPMQRIHIDICAVPSYDRQPMVLRNHYGVEMGTSGLIIQAQSREEILADKMVAFSLRRNRHKNRDLWDIGWLKQQNITLPVDLVRQKAADRNYDAGEFIKLLSDRMNFLLEGPEVHRNFVDEMKRFLPPGIVTDTVEKNEFWSYLLTLIQEETSLITAGLQREGSGNEFRM